jgi:polysaccharide export outer membrane protein
MASELSPWTHSIEPEVPGETSSIVSADYHVGAGDILLVQVYGEPSLSGQLPVDASGELDFPLIGRLKVAGMTPFEITQLLKSRLMAGYINNPSITVSVHTYKSQPVQVLGAVSKPGIYFLRGPTSVMQILSEAGGVSPEGVNEVRITHANDQTQTVVVPYEQLLLQGIASLPLTAGDIVFVPRSVVSVIGQVGKPGDIAFREGLTVSHCIAAAGGALPTAALNRLYILRGEERIKVNLRKILNGDAPDIELQAGDKLYIPESAV